MPTVSKLITLAQRLTGDTSSRAFLLTVLDGRVKELYAGMSGAHRRYFDPSTDKHPYLETTAGTLQYDYPTWAQSIMKVYDVDLSDPDRDFYPEYAATCDDSKRKITFAEDPGTETTKYALLGTYLPTDMDSEADSLCIVPDSRRFPLLVVGMVSFVQPTKAGYEEARWQDLKADFRAQIRVSSSPRPRQRRVKHTWGRRYGYTPPDYSQRL